MEFKDKEITLLLGQNERLIKQNQELLYGELEQRKVLKKAISFFGEEMQIFVAVEEMGELLQALSKFKRHEGDVNNIIEEIADVEIMMQQLCLIFDCSNDVATMKSQKIERLKEKIKRLENERNE